MVALAAGRDNHVKFGEKSDVFRAAVEECTLVRCKPGIASDQVRAPLLVVGPQSCGVQGH